MKSNTSEKHLKMLVWAVKTRTNADGTPLSLRLRIGQDRAEIGIQARVNLKYWKSSKQKVAKRHPESKRINRSILELKQTVEDSHKALVILGQTFTVKDLKSVVTGVKINRQPPKQTKKLLLELLKNYQLFLDKQESKADLAFNTCKTHRHVIRKIKDYVENEIKTKRVEVQQLDLEWAEEFEYYLRSKKGLAMNTSMKTMKIFKRILNWGVRNKWMKENPLSEFKCTFKWKVREVLDQEEIDRLAKKEFNIQRIDLVRDLFLFACYTGLSYSDVVNLKENHIIKGIDGNQWIRHRRTKTDALFNTPILPPAEAILEKYKEHPAVYDSAKLLPSISNQKLNTYLKEVQDVCGIKKSLTYHLARHTFATTIALANGVPLESVAKMLGHKKLATTQIYAQVLEQKLSQDTQKLFSKFNKDQDNTQKDVHTG